MFSLICVWINDWVNNRKAGDLRRIRAHYDVSVMHLANIIPADALMTRSPVTIKKNLVFIVLVMTSLNGNIFRVTGLFEGSSPTTGGLPSQMPVTRSFDVFFDLRLNTRLSKTWWRHRTHYHVTVMLSRNRKSIRRFNTVEFNKIQICIRVLSFSKLISTKMVNLIISLVNIPLNHKSHKSKYNVLWVICTEF